MSVVVPHKAISRIASATNPREAITDAVGDLSGVRLLGDMVLIGTYIRPETTKGGIIRPDVNVQEDVWQGKVGLVLKLAPDAFKDTTEYSFGGNVAQVGDWCVYKVGDAWSIEINGCPCRIVRDVNVRMIVQDPSIVF